MVHVLRSPQLVLVLAGLAVHLVSCGGSQTARHDDGSERGELDRQLLRHVDAVPTSTSTSTIGVTDDSVVLIVAAAGVASRRTGDLVEWPSNASPSEASTSHDVDEPGDLTAADDGRPGPPCVDATDAVSEALRPVLDTRSGPILIFTDARVSARTLTGTVDAIRVVAPKRRVFLAVVGAQPIESVLSGTTAPPRELAAPFIHVVGPLTAPRETPELTVVVDSEVRTFSNTELGTSHVAPLPEAPDAELDWDEVRAGAVETLHQAELDGDVDATITVSGQTTVADLVRLLDVLRERPAAPPDQTTPGPLSTRADEVDDATPLVERVALERLCRDSAMAEDLISDPRALRALLEADHGADLAAGIRWGVPTHEPRDPFAADPYLRSGVDGLGAGSPSGAVGVEIRGVSSDDDATGSGMREDDADEPDDSINDESRDTGETHLLVLQPMVVRGDLDARQLHDEVKTPERRDEIRACYDASYADVRPRPDIYVTATATLAAGGRVETVEIAGATDGTESVQACVMKRIAAWRLSVPSDAANAEIALPFELGPDD